MIYDRYRHDVHPPAYTTTFLDRRTVGATVTKNETYTGIKNDLRNRSCYDTVVHKFKERVAQGEIFNNDFLSVIDTYDCDGTYEFNARYSPPNPAQATSYHYLGLNGHEINRRYKTYPYASIVLPESSDLQKAQIDALGSVNKTDFDVGTFVGEWQKTKRLHADVCNAFLKALKDSEDVTIRRRETQKIPLFKHDGTPMLNRSGNPIYRYVHIGGDAVGRGKLSKAKAVSNFYLVLRFGVGPLLYDLENAWKFLGRKYAPRNTARGMAFSSGQTTVTGRRNLDKGYFEEVVTTTRTLQTRVGILYDTDDTSRALAGLGLTRPLSTAWELMPYSFVVDYLINVGKWLDAMQPAGFNRTLCAWVSTCEVLAQTVSVGPFVRTVNDAQYETTSTTSNEWLTRTRTTKFRTLWNPTLPKFPAYGTGFNPLRSADLAALVLQRLHIRL